MLCGTVSFKGLSQLEFDMETKQTNRMVRIKNKQVNEISARVTGTQPTWPGPVSIPAKVVVVATIVVIVCCAI